MSYKLYAIRVFSTHWDRALEFYRDVVGFKLVYEDKGLGWAQFDLGSTYLGLERCDPSDPETKTLVGRFVGASIEVEEIETTYKQLIKKGVQFVAPPEKQIWGGTLAHFKDPDENILTLLGQPDMSVGHNFTPET